MARKTPRRTRRPARIGHVGQALIEAQERKRKATAEAIRRIAGAS
jgi:hypothetical protein